MSDGDQHMSTIDAFPDPLPLAQGPTHVAGTILCTTHHSHIPRHVRSFLRHAAATMNSFNSRPFARNASKTFRPAFDYLSNISQSNIHLPTTSKHSATATHRRKTTADSIDDTDDDLENNTLNMDRRSHSRHGSQEAGGSLAPAIPLIDIGSRSASPNPHTYPRSRSAAQSEDEDDEYELSSSIRPLVGGGRAQYGAGSGSWNMVFRQGGLGGWLFGTWAGWQVCIGVLVFWVGGCGFGLLLMNRFIMLTGVYK